MCAHVVNMTFKYRRFLISPSSFWDKVVKVGNIKEFQSHLCVEGVMSALICTHKCKHIQPRTNLKPLGLPVTCSEV